MLVDISFPKPVPYNGGEGIPGPEGKAHHLVTEQLVAKAFQSTSTKKSPGPDTLGPLAIRCLLDWEPDRIVALIWTNIRLGVYPDQWKTARGVTIPKPG